MTVRETLMNQALTDAERDLLNIWFEEKSDLYCARQRAWAEVTRRTRTTRTDLKVCW